MPNPAADFAEPPVSSSGDDSAEEKALSDSEALRKFLPHPSTAVMVKEALEKLDSCKGVSTLAIHNFIKQKYPSVDMGRTKTLIRKALSKGLENGTFVRPHSSSESARANGRFRLAPIKKSKPKKENVDPNVQKAPEPAKVDPKKPKKAGAINKDPSMEPTKTRKNSKPFTKSKKAEGSAAAATKAEGSAAATKAEVSSAATMKAAPAKKPKAKKTAAKKDGEEKPESTKPKGSGKATAASKTKTTAAKTKEATAGKASKSKAAKVGGDAPASKAGGKLRKKAAE